MLPIYCVCFFFYDPLTSLWSLTSQPCVWFIVVLPVTSVCREREVWPSHNGHFEMLWQGNEPWQTYCLGDTTPVLPLEVNTVLPVFVWFLYNHTSLCLQNIDYCHQRYNHLLFLSLTTSLINCWVYQLSRIVKNACYGFPKPKVIFSDVLVCSVNCPKS